MDGWMDGLVSEKYYRIWNIFVKPANQIEQKSSEIFNLIRYLKHVAK